MIYIECLNCCEIWTALHFSAKQIFAFLKPKRNLDNIDFKKMKSVEIWERQSTQTKLIKYRSKELSDTVFVIEEFYYCNFILRQIIKWNVNISLWSVSEVLNAVAIFWWTGWMDSITSDMWGCFWRAIMCRHPQPSHWTVRKQSRLIIIIRYCVG